MRTVVDAGDAHVETVLAVFLALRLTRVKGYLWLELHRARAGQVLATKLSVRLVDFRLDVDSGFNFSNFLFFRCDVVIRRSQSRVLSEAARIQAKE